VSVKRVRGGSGLGDSLYIRPISDHLLREGHQVTVCTFYPDVFLGSACSLEPFGRLRINVVCHYVNGKNNPKTNQWEDICECAGVKSLPLRFEWSVFNKSLVDAVIEKARGRKIVLIHGGREPMNRTDGFGAELLPEKKAFDWAQEAIYKDVLFVRVGSGGPKYAMDRAELDLWGKTSVRDLLDLAWICDGLVGPCSFFVPLAECFDKPFLAIWAASGLYRSREPYIKTITPQKILSKKTSMHVIDEWDQPTISEKACGFRQLL
jgi:hypothetical protein